MSTLLSNQLKNTVAQTQDFRVKKPVVLHAVRVYLMKHGTLVDGTLNIKIKDGSDVVATKTIPYTEFETVGATYAQGYFSVEFNAALGGRQDGEASHEYTLELEMTGHTDSDSVFVSWLRDWENPIVDLYGSNQTSGVADSDTYSANGIEFYVYRS